MHVSNLCTKLNPLTSILFFTDGAHSPGIDYDDGGIHGLQPNIWHARSVDEFLNLGENVICGLIDYDLNSSIGNFPKYTTLAFTWVHIGCYSSLASVLGD